MERVSVLIDAGNFYHLVLKKLGLHEIDFDFDRFSAFLVGERTLAADGKRFYIATVRERQGRHETKQAMAHQTSLFTRLLGATPPWALKTSKLRTRVERLAIDDRVLDSSRLLQLGIRELWYERSREKGIDVKIAVDLIAGAIDDKYDIAVLVSSDTDLVPAIDWARKRMKKKVEYVGFSIPDLREPEKSTKPTKTMIYATDIQHVLAETDLRSFIVPESGATGSSGAVRAA